MKQRRRKAAEAAATAAATRAAACTSTLTKGFTLETLGMLETPGAPRRRKEEEDAIEELRKEAQAMRRTGNPEWLSMHARMRALMDRGREAKKDPRVEAWRREASEWRMKAREAKSEGRCGLERLAYKIKESI